MSRAVLALVAAMFGAAFTIGCESAPVSPCEYKFCGDGGPIDDAGGGGAAPADAGPDALPYCEFVDPSLGPTCPPLPQAIVARCYDGGPCQIVACIPNFADCNGQAADGCEVDVQNDSNNCGACGNVCPDTMSTCIDMACH